MKKPMVKRLTVLAGIAAVATMLAPASPAQARIDILIWKVQKVDDRKEPRRCLLTGVAVNRSRHPLVRLRLVPVGTPLQGRLRLLAQPGGRGVPPGAVRPLTAVLLKGARKCGAIDVTRVRIATCRLGGNLRCVARIRRTRCGPGSNSRRCGPGVPASVRLLAKPLPTEKLYPGKVVITLSSRYYCLGGCFNFKGCNVHIRIDNLTRLPIAEARFKHRYRNGPKDVASIKSLPAGTGRSVGSLDFEAYQCERRPIQLYRLAACQLGPPGARKCKAGDLILVSHIGYFRTEP